MSARPILVYPNKQLRAQCVDVYDWDQSLHELAIDLRDTMRAVKAAGLAAIQIGDTRRVIVLRGAYVGLDEPLFLVNPVLALPDYVEKDRVSLKEGCLSFPNAWANVLRWPTCTVSARSMEGYSVAYKAEGEFAQALQHEVDHLDGKLLIDLAGPVRRDVIRRKFKGSPQHAARVDHVPGHHQAEVRQ